MSHPSPVLGRPGGADDKHFSGTEYQNQKTSRGPGRISIDRGEHDNTYFKAGKKQVPRRRPSGG